MKRKCEIKFTDNEVILGLMTFLDEENDGEHKVIIHRVDTIIEADSPGDAEKIGEYHIVGNYYDSYLVPSMYTGDIEVQLYKGL